MTSGEHQPDSSPAIRVEASDSLGEYARAWDDLVQGMPIPSPFLRSWWLDSGATSSPSIVLVLRADRLIGGLALQRDRHLGVERLRVLGSGVLCPDHLDAVAAPSMEQVVVGALRDWLSRGGDRLIDLDGIVTSSLVRAALPGRVRRDHTATAPFIALTAGTPMQSSAGLRRRVARTDKRLRAEAGDCRVELVGDLDTGLQLLRRLHMERWGGASGFLDGFASFAGVCRAAASRGEVLFYALYAGDDAIAVTVSFDVGGRVSHYQSGRDTDRRWHGAGTLLQARLIDEAVQRGSREVDLLRGEEAYKADFATGGRDLWRLRSATGPRAAAALIVDIAAQRGRRLAGRARGHLQRLVSHQSPPQA
ncbi:MAG: GNAT family N-acetyltransferase [Candidatus Dormibacteraeota bacterium]|uniref:GNAT family N-acetyltransferase n=1 Tax=Candidatus Aeolococcus gillhamiae TaxID=3127015 RepID=A0A2W5Z9S2_9BACT|nr:GNAT family N-acetyltransferase [Candidatus Dormibacteraeota bacterium]PZR79625.1 MAG: hypothetical protein DLM65_10145 [Candidatus Dormibacter sp. RRmetagenome_bin12]